MYQRVSLSLRLDKTTRAIIANYAHKRQCSHSQALYEIINWAARHWKPGRFNVTNVRKPDKYKATYYLSESTIQYIRDWGDARNIGLSQAANNICILVAMNSRAYTNRGVTDNG